MSQYIYYEAHHMSTYIMGQNVSVHLFMSRMCEYIQYRAEYVSTYIIADLMSRNSTQRVHIVWSRICECIYYEATLLIYILWRLNIKTTILFLSKICGHNKDDIVQ